VGREALPVREDCCNWCGSAWLRPFPTDRDVHNPMPGVWYSVKADRLPGLMLTGYNDVFTLQVLTQAWAAPERKQAIIAGLKKLLR